VSLVLSYHRTIFLNPQPTGGGLSPPPPPPVTPPPLPIDLSVLHKECYLYPARLVVQNHITVSMNVNHLFRYFVPVSIYVRYV